VKITPAKRISPTIPQAIKAAGCVFENIPFRFFLMSAIALLDVLLVTKDSAIF